MTQRLSELIETDNTAPRVSLMSQVMTQVTLRLCEYSAHFIRRQNDDATVNCGQFSLIGRSYQLRFLFFRLIAHTFLFSIS